MWTKLNSLLKKKLRLTIKTKSSIVLSLRETHKPNKYNLWKIMIRTKIYWQMLVQEREVGGEREKGTGRRRIRGKEAGIAILTLD